MISGIFLLLGIHILVFAVLGFLSSIIANLFAIYTVVQILAISIFYIGLSQFLYVIPIIFWLIRQQRWGLMKGVIIGAVLTALLNGGCWLLITSASR
ncbi:hypothetical protein [Coleofasciculus sp. H7-2]|uniref:hypothetical protein n=1 Tax=Coleofasciculus sp. H7-2 TaxID=3351545 RepID=UPI00366F35CA